ncbi:uncharacterized protein METZ01_LOCUS81374, partial [marine metagenome]
MLSKFTNKFKTYYDLHDIEEEKAKLEILKKKNVANITNSDIKEIVSYMKHYKLSLELLPIILNIISNICMREINVERFEYIGGIKIIIEIFKLYEDNSKIQWLICSCLWNISRVPNMRG